MTVVLLLVAAILLLALLVFMELTELAGAMFVLILVSSGGVYIVDPANAWLAFGTITLAAVVVMGLVAYRYLRRRPPPGSNAAGNDGGTRR